MAFQLNWITYIDFPVGGSGSVRCNDNEGESRGLLLSVCPGGGRLCSIVGLLQSFISFVHALQLSRCASPLGAEPAGHPPVPARSTMDRAFRLLATCLLCLLCSRAGETRGRERVYYIGIVEDTWNYAPSGKNLLNGKDIANDE